MAELTLYHWEPNANSGKPMLALVEKGVPFASHYIDMLRFDQHQPDYLAVNPQGTIPAMVHGARVLTESTAIMEYVDEAFDGPALMPGDAQDRWRIRWWMKFMDQWLGPSFSMIGWCTFVGPSLAHKSPEEREAMIARIGQRAGQPAERPKPRFRAIVGTDQAWPLPSGHDHRLALRTQLLSDMLQHRPAFDRRERLVAAEPARPTAGEDRAQHSHDLRGAGVSTIGTTFECRSETGAHWSLRT